MLPLQERPPAPQLQAWDSFLRGRRRLPEGGGGLALLGEVSPVRAFPTEHLKGTKWRREEAARI